jgi:hypothetical protein
MSLRHNTLLGDVATLVGVAQDQGNKRQHPQQQQNHATPTRLLKSQVSYASKSLLVVTDNITLIAK